MVVRKWLDGSVHFYGKDKPLLLEELLLPQPKEVPAACLSKEFKEVALRRSYDSRGLLLLRLQWQWLCSPHPHFPVGPLYAILCQARIAVGVYPSSALRLWLLTAELH